MGGWVGGVEHFSVSARHVGFWVGTKGFGAKGSGPGLDNNRMKSIGELFPSKKDI